LKVIHLAGLIRFADSLVFAAFGHDLSSPRDGYAMKTRRAGATSSEPMQG
jgi:hypothetical protein